MSEHRITLTWKRTSTDFTYPTYNRAHTWTFKNGLVVDASAATAYRGDADRVDPEEAFVASLSSCHMLTFLAIAARRGFVVDRYVDAAVGHLEKNAEGRLAITRVELRPAISFGAGAAPDAAMFAQMHDESHHQCFIANSVKTEIHIEAPMAAGRA
jgi:organic hydroperoxide reductase OsmC/OhrA